jgi:hypothetical protein
MTYSCDLYFGRDPEEYCTITSFNFDEVLKELSLLEYDPFILFLKESYYRQYNKYIDGTCRFQLDSYDPDCSINDFYKNKIHLDDLISFCKFINSEASRKLLDKISGKKRILTYYNLNFQPIRFIIDGNILYNEKQLYFGGRDICEALGIDNFQYIAKLIKALSKITSNGQYFLHPDDPENLMLSYHFITALIKDTQMYKKFAEWVEEITSDFAPRDLLSEKTVASQHGQ